MANKHQGLYVHVPFCDGKCPYCDFYSVAATDRLRDDYLSALVRELEHWRRENTASLDSVYIGGGTPLMLGIERLEALICSIKDIYTLTDDCEITVEVNPRSGSLERLKRLKTVGVNRLSIGVQSAIDGELRLLGRRHTFAEAAETFGETRLCGFDNISLDLMLATPEQTERSLCESIERLCDLSPEHISAYILKLEQGTPYYERYSSDSDIMDDDRAARLYTTACERLAERGYEQYEISNFAKGGRVSRHNLRYWDDREYIGVGASAHGFVNGRRYYYDRDIAGFIDGNGTIADGEGGSSEEYIMLRLRLCEGLTESGYRERFGTDIPAAVRDRAIRLLRTGLVVCDDEGIRLTRSGFLVSNAVISELLS